MSSFWMGVLGALFTFFIIVAGWGMFSSVYQDGYWDGLRCAKYGVSCNQPRDYEPLAEKKQ